VQGAADERNVTCMWRREKKEVCYFQIPPIPMNIGGPVPSNLCPHIFIGFETDEYNLNIFIGSDEFKNLNKLMTFYCSVTMVR
jgi:hypothetical protein